MRLSKWLAAPLAAALLALPTQARAQLGLSVRFGTRLGPDIGVVAYSPEHHGDWHANYRKWTPVTLYDVNGHYYRNAVEGARPVVVYSYNGEYFFPPTDRTWVGFDRRYNYKRAPVEVDIGRARPYVPVERVDPRFGAELGIFGFNARLAGDWHRDYKRWSPVTVYEYHGHYYPHNAPGARAVQIYRYQNEYFFPPQDRAWVGFDKRFNYERRPNEEDFRRGRERP
jgi:hypothetical protein